MHAEQLRRFGHAAADAFDRPADVARLELARRVGGSLTEGCSSLFGTLWARISVYLLFEAHRLPPGIVIRARAGGFGVGVGWQNDAARSGGRLAKRTSTSA